MLWFFICRIRKMLFTNSVQLLIRVWLFATPWITARQASLSITNSRSSLRLMSIESVMPSNHLILVTPFSCPQSFPASESFPTSGPSGGQSIGALASVLPMNIQDWFPFGWTGLSLCSPRDSKGSCSVPQFKSINTLAFGLLYGPALTFIHH